MIEKTARQSMTLAHWVAIVLCLLSLVLLYQLQAILMPFLLAILIAYLGDPVVDLLEARKINRTVAVAIVFAGLFSLATLSLLLILPALAAQLDRFVMRLPTTLAWLQDLVLPQLQAAGLITTERLSVDELKVLIQQHWQQAGSFAGQALSQLSASGMVLLTWVANVFLIPVVSFYLLRDWDVIVARVRILIPRAWEPKVVVLVTECDEVLSAFLRGQLMVMLALGVIYSIGLSIVGIELALLLGTIAGLASVVPYMGVVVGLGASLLAAYFQFHDVSVFIPVLLVFGFGQLLEGMVLTPLLVGDKIGLHPVAVIFAVMAGGQLAGFTGILLALPVAAIILVWLKHVHEQYLDSRLYDPDPASCEDSLNLGDGDSGASNNENGSNNEDGNNNEERDLA
jgi:predicted PurR-regulated permease PerM